MKDNLLITGHSKGLGRYLAENLSGNYQVSGIARTGLKNSSITNYNLDLQDFDSYDSFFETISSENKKFSAVILNAGVGAFGKFSEISAEKYKDIIEINLLSPIIFLQKLLPFLENDAKIIFIGSIIGKKFLPGGAVYGASKFGLRGFAGILRKEYKKNVYIINPNILKTDFHKDCLLPLPNGKITNLEDIHETVVSILAGKEQRFEIDL